MRIALVAIAKDEDDYIAEWWEYHHHIGFTDIFVYQNDWRWKGDVPEYVHLVEWDGRCRQLDAYNDFIGSSKSRGFDWAMFLDIDEFLVPVGFKSAQDLFLSSNEKYAIGFNWRAFGSSGIKQVGDDKSVIGRFVRSQVGLNKHIKTALNLSKARDDFLLDDVRFVNPHFVGIALRWRFTQTPDGQYYITGPFSPQYGNSQDTPYIAHYFTKSRQEFIERRSRPRADTGQVREGLGELFQEYDRNEIQNLDVVNFNK